MFEKILEKVLLSNVGHFIDGIDRNNLKIGIWSGDIVIQNISVKPEVLEMLDLPVKMKYSFVGKLSVSVPWKSLGSKPVEILLEDVFVIVEPVGKESWKSIDYKSVSKRLELMESFVQSYLNKIAEKQAQENKDAKKEEQGMVAKLTERVIDNIQITVRNIHLRFENPLSKRKYAWGITLDEILVYTTNKNWEKEFIDRTDSKNSLEPMRKMLSLKNLGVYWTSNVSELFGNMAAQYIKQNMKDLILKDQMPEKQKMEYMIAISATCKLVQKNKKDLAATEQPEFDISLDLKPLNLQLKKPQLEDVIRLLEFFNGFQRYKVACMKEREKEIQKMSSEEIEKMKGEFKDLFDRVYRSEKAQDLKGEEKVRVALTDESETDRFNILVMSLHDEDLSKSIKEVVKQVERERRTKAVEAQKFAQTEKKSGWFGWGSNKKEELQKSESLKLDAEDIDAIDKYIQEAFGGEEEDTVAKLEQLAYQNLFHIAFTLEGGSFYLSDVTPSGNEEGVTLSYQRLSATIDVNSKGQHVSVTLKDYGVYLRTRYTGATTYTDTPFIRRLNYWMPAEAAGSMISLVFDQNPQGKEEGTYINLDSQAVEIVFRPVAIERIVNFFDVSTQDEALKSQALEQLEKVQDRASQAATQAVQSTAKKEISIKFAAPVLIIPFLQNADVKSECWVINLGDLFVNTEDEETKIYERYGLGLKNLRFQYFPSQVLYMKASRSLKEKNDLSSLTADEKEEYKRVFNLIEKFNIDIKVEKMIAGYENREGAKDKPRMNVDITIPTIDLQLNPQVYKNLLKTGEFVSYSKESAMELMEDERTKLMAGHTKLGTIYVREKKIRDIVWNKYLCIFKGTYLYLFKNPTDARPAFTYYIRGAEVTLKDDPERENVFVIENRYNTAYLSGENEKQRDEWIAALKQKIKEYKAVSANVFEVRKPNAPKDSVGPKTTAVDNYNVVTLNLLFQIKEVRLKLFHQMDKKLFDLDTKNFIVNLRQQPAQTEVRLKLESLDVADYLVDYVNPSLKKLITSAPSQGNNVTDLIEIYVKTLDKTHPDYGKVKTDLEITMKFGYLFVNYKPLTIQETMKFFVSSSDTPSSATSSPKKTDKTEAKEIKPIEAANTIYTQGTDHTMLKLNIELKEISAKFIHKKTHVCMGELTVKSTTLSIQMKPLSMEVSGVLGNIQLFDTTNYPNTVDSNIEYEKVLPYEMLGVGEQNKNLIEVSYKSFDRRHPEADTVNNIYSYVDVKISSIRVNYLHQPVMRLIDYLTGQLLPALSTSSEQQKSPDTQAPVVVKLEKEVAQANLQNLQFMDLKVFIKTPIVVLKPTPASSEYLEIRLGNIAISSERVKNKDRFTNPTKPLEHVFCERHNIKLSEMGIYRVEGDSKLEVSKPVNFDMSFERLLFVEEYKLIYSEGQEIMKTKFNLKTDMNLDGRMSPLIVMLTHEDYLLIMKCLNFNIAYDDRMDKMFISDYEAAVANQNQPGTPLNINLVFENFTLLAIDKSQLPFAMVTLHLMQVSVAREATKKMTIKISARELNGSYFENQDNTLLTEKKMLGALDRVNTFQIEGNRQLQVVEDIIKKTSTYVHEISMSHASKAQERTEQLLVSIIMEPKGDKDIKVNIRELKAYLITNIYLHLLEFIKLDESVNPSSKQLVSISSLPDVPDESKPVEVKQVEQPEEVAPQGNLTFVLDVQEILVTMPSTISNTKDTPNVLAFRGDLSFKYVTFTTPTLEDALTDKKKDYKKAIDQISADNQTGKIQVELERMEIFVCEFADLLQAKNFNQVKKRNMILPFSLILIRNSHMVLNKERTELINVTKTHIDVQRIIFKVSYQDAMLLNNSINFQLDQLKSPEDEANKKKEEEKKMTREDSKEEVASVKVDASKLLDDKKDRFEESKENFSQGDKGAIMPVPQEKTEEIGDEWKTNLEDYEIASHGIQIVLINDAEGTLVPVLEFTMFELKIAMLKLPEKLKLSGVIILNCSYFNPVPSKWEPFIEKFGLSFELSMKDNPKIDISISTTAKYEEINIDISEQMLAILYSTSMTWKEGYQSQRSLRQGKNVIVRANSTIREEDVIDYVSPYTIVNHTGYPIQIEADNTSNTISAPTGKTTSTGRPSTNLKQTYNVENRGSTQYLVESDIDKMFQKSMQDMLINSNKIRVKILHPTQDIKPVGGLDIDSSCIKRYPLNANGQSGVYRIFSLVKIHQNKKIITLTSPFRITNKVLTPCIVTLEAQGQKVEVRLDTNDSTAIPIDFVQGTFSIKLDVPGAVPSPKASIKDLTGTENKMLEISTGSSYIFSQATRVDQENDLYEISLLPPFQVKNCCGLEVEYRFVDHREQNLPPAKLQPQEALHETSLTLKQPAYLKIRMQGYFWSQKFIIHSPDPKVRLIKQIQLQDITNNTLNVVVFIPEGDTGTRKLYLYTKTCFVNETPYDLRYFTIEDRKKNQIPGQTASSETEVFNTKVTLFNEVTSVAFSRTKEKEMSKPVNLATMGNTAAELLSENGTSMLELGINMSLIRCDKDYNLITKIITISPRFILVNKTDCKIQVKREQGTNTIATLEKEVRTPFYWSDWAAVSQRDKSISISPVSDSQGSDFWSWSNGFDIQAIGVYNFLVQSKDKTQQKYFKTTVDLHHSTIFVMIEEEPLEKIAFKVRNTCQGVKLLVYQTGDNPNHGATVEEGQTIPWSWMYPNKKKEVSATFTLETGFTYSTPVKFSYDSLNTLFKVQIPVSKDVNVEILASIAVEGSTRVLKFFLPTQIKLDMKTALLISNEYRLKAQNAPKEIISLNVEVSIKHLGVSLISSLRKKDRKGKERREVLYFVFKNILFRMVDSNQNKSSQIRIKYLNIDNNTSDESSFPVLWTPNKPKDLLDPATKNYFLDALVTQKVTPEFTFYETVQFLLDASTLKVDGMFIDAIMELINNFSNIGTANQYADGKRTIAESLYKSRHDAKKLEDKDYFNSRFEWKKTELSEFAGGNLYIKKLVLNALFLNISFQLKKKDTAEDTFFLINLLTSVLGTALANLDNAPLTLSGIVLDNVFDSKEAITKKIIDKYKDEVTKSIPKLLGSLDIVGNPVGLFTNISSGVTDLIEKPLEGFLQGPLEGGKGIVMGAQSLVKNTVSGTFNSIGKVTGSLASGLSNLTMDDEYMAEREKSKIKRPKHVGEGVVQGVTSIVKGVGEGVTGIFTKPIEGATKGGFSGFFKGALQGVTGLVVKPVTGVLDAAANTAEGIKNTATVFDQKASETRTRFPRAFYGKDKFYRTYAATDAEVQWLLKFSDQVRFRNVSLLSSYEVFPDEKEKDQYYFLIISLESIILWSGKQNNVKWAIDTSNIEKMDKLNEGIIIKLKEATPVFRDRLVNIKNCDSTQNEYIYKKLTELVNYIKQQ